MPLLRVVLVLASMPLGCDESGLITIFLDVLHGVDSNKAAAENAHTGSRLCCWACRILQDNNLTGTIPTQLSSLTLNTNLDGAGMCALPPLRDQMSTHFIGFGFASEEIAWCRCVKYTRCAWY